MFADVVQGCRGTGFERLRLMLTTGLPRVNSLVPSNWKWLALKGLPYHGTEITYFATREGGTFRISATGAFRPTFPKSCTKPMSRRTSAFSRSMRRSSRSRDSTKSRYSPAISARRRRPYRSTSRASSIRARCTTFASTIASATVGNPAYSTLHRTSAPSRCRIEAGGYRLVSLRRRGEGSASVEVR